MTVITKRTLGTFALNATFNMRCNANIHVISIFHDELPEQGRESDASCFNFGRNINNRRTDVSNIINFPVYRKKPFEGGMINLDNLSFGISGSPNSFSNANAPTYAIAYGTHLGSSIDRTAILSDEPNTGSLGKRGDVIDGDAGDSNYDLGYFLNKRPLDLEKTMFYYSLFPQIRNMQADLVNGALEKGTLIKVLVRWTGTNSAWPDGAFNVPDCNVYLIYTNIERPYYWAGYWYNKCSYFNWGYLMGSRYEFDDQMWGNSYFSNPLQLSSYWRRFTYLLCNSISVAPKDQTSIDILKEVFDSPFVVGMTYWCREMDCVPLIDQYYFPGFPTGDIAPKYNLPYILDNTTLAPDDFSEGGITSFDTDSKFVYGFLQVSDDKLSSSRSYLPIAATTPYGSILHTYYYLSGYHIIDVDISGIETFSQVISCIPEKLFTIPYYNGDGTPMVYKVTYFGKLGKILNIETGSNTSTIAGFGVSFTWVTPANCFAFMIEVGYDLDNLVNPYLNGGLPMHQYFHAPPAYYASRRGDFMPGSIQTYDSSDILD